jgi:CRP/FNR family transcriptional regulator, cyclic AMP receptor protein
MPPTSKISAPSAARSLAGMALFADLPEAARKQIEKACRWRTYDAEQTIIAHDDPGNDVYFVVAGLARVVLYSATGREVSFDDIGPGACVGELAAIDGGKRSAGIVALAPSLVAILPRAAFLETLAAEPKAALALLNRLAAALRQATGRIFELSTLGAHNRVYAELLRLARPAAAGGRIVIRPIPAHGDIAARVSATRETVARALSDLAKKGIVAREKQELVVRDPKRLKTMVSTFSEA